MKFKAFTSVSFTSMLNKCYLFQFGLSEAELEDILSLDDTVLTSIYSYQVQAYYSCRYQHTILTNIYSYQVLAYYSYQVLAYYSYQVLILYSYQVLAYVCTILTSFFSYQVLAYNPHRYLLLQVLAYNPYQYLLLPGTSIRSLPVYTPARYQHIIIILISIYSYQVLTYTHHHSPVFTPARYQHTEQCRILTNHQCPPLPDNSL